MSLDKILKPAFEVDNKPQKVYYRGTQVLGYSDEKIKLTALEMQRVENNYEKLLKQRNFKKAKEIEARKNYPKTWLNLVISYLIDDNGLNGTLSKELKNEFKYRK
jgi:hypothetical protein